MSHTEPMPRPPILSRSATFYTELSEESFEQYRDDWNQAIGTDYPEACQEPRWEFELDGYEHGIPKLKDTRPAMWVNYWHERELDAGCGYDRVSVYSGTGKKLGGISFEISRGPHGGGRAFTELKSQLNDNLPKFTKVFGVDKFKTIELRYVNLIRSDIYPEFGNTAGAIDLDKILETHAQLHLPGYGFMLPYKHEMVCKASQEKPMVAKVNIEVLEPFKDEQGHSDGKVSLTVEFTMRSRPEQNDDSYTVAAAMAEIDDCHEKVLDFFEKTFISSAKELFTTPSTSNKADNS